MASLYFKFAAMNSGKSTQLLQAHYNYFERGMNPMALTAKIDDRFGSGKITARIGLDLHAEVFTPETDVYALVAKAHEAKKVDALLIDEAQFLTPAQVMECARLVDDMDIPVMCYGLKTDFMGKLFPGSEALLRFADNLEEIKTICWCGRKATHTARVTSKGDVVREGAQIAIGGNDMYVSLCRKHFMRGEPAAQKASDKDKAAA
ncbi:MAG TPA: thymidine kinase [Alphaproteobacteria bacterium]|nr:thymidine kinase [Rhodospirillaceae bacterium]HRI77012.1 thymidine kinase [Alphaproteobacteria bacterium]HRJ66067.1 thymidine kinase [Alphaproteobacteria bacterium]